MDRRSHANGPTAGAVANHSPCREKRQREIERCDATSATAPAQERAKTDHCADMAHCSDGLRDDFCNFHVLVAESVRSANNA